MNERVIVVGAGIAGLTAAFRLRQQGCDVTVLEAEPVIGGRMRSLKRDGFTFDLAAVALSDKYAAMHRLMDDLGIRGLAVPCPDLIGIPKDGAIHRLNTGSPFGAARTGLLSWRTKLRAAGAALDGYRMAKGYDWNDLGAQTEFDRESAHEWAMRRGGAELAYVIDAVMRGGLMTDTKLMSAIDMQFLAVKFFGTSLFTFADGVGVLPDTLATQLDVRCDTRVIGVEETRNRVRVTSVSPNGPEQTEDADACVIALSAHQMAAVHPQLPADRRAVIDRVDYVRLIAVNLALSRRPAEPALFLAFAEQAEPDLAAIFFGHNRHPNRAPIGKGVVTIYWHHDWNTANWDIDDHDLLTRSTAAAERYIPELAGSVLFHQINRWDPSFIYSKPGIYTALHEVARARANARRIHLAGDYFGGPATNTSLCSAELAAQHLTRSLRQHRATNARPSPAHHTAA